MYKLFLCLAALLITSGCKSYEVSFNNGSKPISVKKSLYVMLPKDGHYGTKLYAKSGQIAQYELVNALRKKIKGEIKVASSITSVQEGILVAKKQKMDLLVCPEITQWEDRNSAASGIRDKAGLNIKIIDVTTKKVISNADLYGKGRNGLMALKDRPERILPYLFEKYMIELFKN